MTDYLADSLAVLPELPATPFIFVTVGTDHHRFDRLVSHTVEWTRKRNMTCFIQAGTSDVPDDVQGTDYLPYDTMRAAMQNALAVVCHGGPATIMLARQVGRIPIVMPRDPKRGEHVDAHQVEFSRWMAAKHQVELAESTTDLERQLEAACTNPVAFRIPVEKAPTSLSVARFSRLVGDLLDAKSRA